MGKEETECIRAANPRSCSPEQIRKCHGDDGHPCTDAGECLGAPDPSACTEEQRAKCHGGATK